MKFTEVTPDVTVRGFNYGAYVHFQNELNTLLIERADYVFTRMRAIFWKDPRDHMHRYTFDAIDTEDNTIRFSYWSSGEEDYFNFPIALCFLSNEALETYLQDLYDAQLREEAEKKLRLNQQMIETTNKHKQMQLKMLLAEKERGEF